MVTSAEKAANLARLADRSVVDIPEATGAPVAPDASHFILWSIAQFASAITAWGQRPKLRDKQLRDFVVSENFLNSALGAVCASNAGLSWKLEGPELSVAASQEMLLNAQWGDGWEEFVARISWDFYSQDNGAYIEIIRASDVPNAPVLGLNQLDAGRCWQTGNPEKPVIYQDRLGRYHQMESHQIALLQEMPSPIEFANLGPYYKLQYSAVTRLLKAAQIIQNISQYKDEKTGGRFARAIHLLRGVTPEAVQQAMAAKNVHADAAGQARYMDPILVGTVDPKADVSHDTIEMASLPDGFKEEESLKWYIAAMALAFGRDYQDFAPLPGGGLGTSNQSQILHLKSKGKGPALFMAKFSRILNFNGILPKSVEFKFVEPDIEAEIRQAELERARAETRKLRIDSFEINPEVARQIAADEGDLKDDYLKILETQDLTPEITVQDTEKPDEKARHSRTRCMNCSAKPTVQIIWAEGRARAWFCGKCFTRWNKQNPGEVVTKKRIDGEADKEAISAVDTLWGHKVTNPVVVKAVNEAVAQFRQELEEEGVELEIPSVDMEEFTNQISSFMKGTDRGGPGTIEERLEVEEIVKERALRALRHMRRRINARLTADA